MNTKYSLAKYILTIKVPASLVSMLGQSISIGGEGSYLDYISVHYNSDQWTTEGDATGGYTHNLSLNRTGTIEWSLTQVSEKIKHFIRLLNVIYTAAGLDDTIDITISQESNTIVSASDCVPTRIPDQRFAATAEKQTWSFNCGKITCTL